VGRGQFCGILREMHLRNRDPVDAFPEKRRTKETQTLGEGENSFAKEGAS